MSARGEAEEPSVQTRDDIALPPNHPLTDNTRVILARKTWSRTLAEKFAQVITNVTPLDGVTFQDAVSFMIEHISNHTQSVTMGQLTLNDGDAAMNWINQIRRGRSTGTGKTNIETPAPTSLRRSNRRTTRTVQDVHRGTSGPNGRELTQPPTRANSNLDTRQDSPDRDLASNNIHNTPSTSLGTSARWPTPQAVY
ncbi:hypothetical protein ACHAPU_009132 [Fusarium lateritium]